MKEYASLRNDVSELKNLQALAIEQVGDLAIFLLDPEGRLTSWNQGVGCVLGYSAEEFTGKSSEILFTPEDVASNAHGRELEEAACFGRASDMRWHVRRDGTRFFCDGIITAIRDSADRTLGYVKVMRDATARYLVEQQSAHFRALVESSDDAILAVTTEHRIASWNRAAQRMFGYEPGEMVGEHLSRLVPAERWHDALGLFARAAAGEPVVGVENVPLAGDRRPIDVSLTLSPILDSAGTLTGFSAIVRDITER